MKALLKRIVEEDTPFKPASKEELVTREKDGPKEQTYTFNITLRGVGYDPQAAWEDAVTYFSEDPGPAPEESEYTIDPVETIGEV